MTMTLDEVPAKLNELDLRAPLEVFEAIHDAISERNYLWSKWQTERCFRAKAEAELAAALKANRDCVDHFEQMQAELAALKAKIFRGIVLDVDDLAAGHAGLPLEWRGKRVRLVVEE